MKYKQGWLQEFSERYYAPYLKWASGLRLNLVVLIIALLFVILSALFS
jgi:hypothetical protein